MTMIKAAERIKHALAATAERDFQDMLVRANDHWKVVAEKEREQSEFQARLEASGLVPYQCRCVVVNWVDPDPTVDQAELMAALARAEQVFGG